MRRGDPKQTNISGITGLGDDADVLYTVPIELGGRVFVTQLDTGSSDLWVITDACHTGTCGNSNVTRYPSSQINSTRTPFKTNDGDSGIVGHDSASVAAIALEDQAFGLIQKAANPLVESQAAGVLGLGFPGQSYVQLSMVKHQQHQSKHTPFPDDFILATYTDGPLIARMALTGQLEEPMFCISLQRDTININGTGQFTVGKLPIGVDNSSLTWVPVRLYSKQDGGISAPEFAPKEVYPLRWEIVIDGVFLNGQRIQDSTIKPKGGVDPGPVTALIDTGNSLIRGPHDMVSDIWEKISLAKNPDDLHEIPVQCGHAQNLSFQIGGKMFSVDPSDLISPTKDSDTCISNVIKTDPPSKASLFSWSLGDPFMKSNIVAFYYGNLTHPSVDPPRIGFLSTVEKHAAWRLNHTVQEAHDNNDTLEESTELAPTASASRQPQVTLTVPPVPFNTSSMVLKKGKDNAASSFVRPRQVINSCAFLVLLSTLSSLF